MSIVQAVCTSFKTELFTGTHNFTASTGDTFKMALYTSDASLGASTTAYTTTEEVVGTGYTAGGTTLTNITPSSSGTTAYIDFDNATWPSSTITARGALIYNSSQSNKAVAVIDFGTNKASSSSTFTVSFPTADSSTAIIKIK